MQVLGLTQAWLWPCQMPVLASHSIPTHSLSWADQWLDAALWRGQAGISYNNLTMLLDFGGTWHLCDGFHFVMVRIRVLCIDDVARVQYFWLANMVQASHCPLWLSEEQHWNSCGDSTWLLQRSSITMTGVMREYPLKVLTSVFGRFLELRWVWIAAIGSRIYLLGLWTLLDFSCLHPGGSARIHKKHPEWRTFCPTQLWSNILQSWQDVPLLVYLVVVSLF